MFRDSLYNRGSRNRQQAVNKRGEGLMLSRRPGHVASALVLLTLLVVPLHGRLPQDHGDPGSTARAAKNNQGATQPGMPALQPQPTTDQYKKATTGHPAEDDNQASAWGPTEWSAVVQAASAAVITFLTVALLIYSHRGWKTAKASTDYARDALLLTQRADVLVDAIGLEPQPNPCRLTADTKVPVRFKNHGPTRARDVVIEHSLVIPGAAKKKPAEFPPPPPTTVIGGNDEMNAAFSALGSWYDEAIIAEASKGHVPLRLAGRITYSDVFGRPHTTTYEALYYGQGRGCFIIQKTDAD